jgi:MFS family permease
MRRRGPLADSYPGAVGLVVASLVPYLALTAGVFPLAGVIGKALGLSPSTLQVTVALSTGAYAVGTVLAIQFAVHLPARRMLVVYETLFVAACVTAAAAPTGAVFVAGFIVQGLCTSLLLIAAVPPLVTRWPARKMPVTGAIMNLCIFGAVTLGPSLGALQLGAGAWRPLFWGVAGVAVVALLLSLLTFQDDPPQDRSAPWDFVALALAFGGCGAAFFGAGDLQASGTAGAGALAPLVGGTALIGALVVVQYRMRRPLMPVREAATTVPATGIFVALTASAAAFGLMELVLQVLKSSSSASRTALLFLPEFVAAIAVAGLFGALFRTRWTPVLALGGLLAIVASAAVLLATLPATGPAVAVATGLLGLGVAASVSPALFMTGFSLPSKSLQRVFALIELLRGVTAFLVAPILSFLAGVLSSGGTGGVEDAVWICLAIAAAGAVGGTALYLSGRRGLRVPDLELWQGGDAPAWDSPPMLARLRQPGPGPHRGAGWPQPEDQPAGR